MTWQPTQLQGKKNHTNARTLIKKVLSWKPKKRDFGRRLSVSFLSIPSKLICEVKLFFNLHLHNYFRIINNTVLRINHFSRYLSANEKLCVRENNFILSEFATPNYHAIIILPIYNLALYVYLHYFKRLCPEIKGVGVLKTIINIKTRVKSITQISLLD